MSASTWVRRGAACTVVALAGIAISGCGVVLPTSQPGVPTPGAPTATSIDPSPAVPVATTELTGPEALALGDCVTAQARLNGIAPSEVTVFVTTFDQMLTTLHGDGPIALVGVGTGVPTLPSGPAYVVWLTGPFSPPPLLAVAAPSTSVPSVWFGLPAPVPAGDPDCTDVQFGGSGAVVGRSLTELGVPQALPEAYWRSAVTASATASP